MKNVPVVALILVSALVFESPEISASMREEDPQISQGVRVTRSMTRMARIAELETLRAQKSRLRSQLKTLKESASSDRPNILKRLRFPGEIKRLEDLVREQGGDPGNMFKTLRIQEARIKKERRKSFLTGLVLGGLTGYASSSLLKFFAHTPSSGDIAMAPAPLPSSDSGPLALPCPQDAGASMVGVESAQNPFEGIDPYTLVRPQPSLIPSGITPLLRVSEGFSDPSKALVPYEAPLNLLPSPSISGAATLPPIPSAPPVNFTEIPAPTIPNPNFGYGPVEALARLLGTPYRWACGRS